MWVSVSLQNAVQTGEESKLAINMKHKCEWLLLCVLALWQNVAAAFRIFISLYLGMDSNLSEPEEKNK